jgi:orotidine-5'-phosphate decarboxylase
MKLSPLIVALDVDSMKRAEAVVRRLGPDVDFYKVGMRLYTRYGPEVLKFLRRKKKKIFLDLKYHDIPKTVAEACREATRHRVQMLTLHASGGLEMMREAMASVHRTAREKKIPRPWVMGVTVLTSMEDLSEVGIARSPLLQVKKLALLAKQASLDGVICSPWEISAVKKSLPRNFKIVTPGVRPAGTPAGDQKRIKTPAEAFRLGADAIVVGRPILNSIQPARIIKEILEAARAH